MRTSRRKAISPATLAATVMSVFVAIAMLSGHAAQPRVRYLGWDFHEPIANRVLPDDEVVLLTRDFDLVVGRPGMTANLFIEDAASRADLVAVVDVNDVNGVLAERGTWVNTRLVGTVREILKPTKPPRRVSRGQRLEAEIPGGELRLGQVLVRAGQGDPPRIPQLARFRRYLLFVKNYDGILYPTHTPLMIDDRGNLEYPWPHQEPNQTPNPLQGLTLSDVMKVVRRMKTLPSER